MASPNFKNRTLFHGDNLEFLRAMNSHSVHLIATDPPFNKGRDFHATPDSLAKGASFQDRWSWERDVHKTWTDKIQDDFPAVWEVIDAANAVRMKQTKKNRLRDREEVGSDMGAYLCFMAVRLLEMHRVLREDGSLYLHCDPTASHYLKELLDAIFGWKNFRNEIIWCYSIGGRSKKGFGRKHDVIFRYSKSNKHTFNYKDVSLPMTAHKQDKSGRNFGGKMGVDSEGRQYVEKQGTKDTQGNYRYYRYYLDEGKVPEDWWTDINTIQPAANERTGHPTQKPIKLYERIVKASSNEGDIVLDPFCGCATTLVAAERLKRQWVGIDIWEGAHEQVIDRLKKEYLKGPEGRLGSDWFGKSRKFQFDDAVITYTKTPPNRTDEGGEAVPFLLVRERVREPRDHYGTNAKRREFLLRQYGSVCQGCDRTFDDDRYLELDHNAPRSTGGWNHISNRILLCGPCNRLKSNVYTLIGLRRQNKKRGYMYGQRSQ